MALLLVGRLETWWRCVGVPITVNRQLWKVQAGRVIDDVSAGFRRALIGQHRAKWHLAKFRRNHIKVLDIQPVQCLTNAQLWKPVL